MSKFTRAAATSQALTVVAMEEVSRQGLREADLEHLLLALAVNDQPAGAVLRSLGVTLPEARAAVREHHRAQLESLGIETDLPADGRIVFAETAGYDWSRRARDLMARSAGKGQAGDASAVLRELLAEPSGLITELLTRLGTTPEEILTELASQDAAPSSTKSRRRHRGDGVRGEAQVFIPAPLADVWALIADPERIPEWQTSIAVVEIIGQEPRPGTVWAAHSITTQATGKPARRQPVQQSLSIELVETEPNQRIVWRVSYPDVKRSRPTRTELAVDAAPGGTRLTVVSSWPQFDGSRRIGGVIFLSFQRFLIWIMAFTAASAISRTFRQDASSD